MKLSKFQEVCKVSSKFDMSRKFGVASLQLCPRSILFAHSVPGVHIEVVPTVTVCEVVRERL